jgi:hypothetical protein
MNKIDIFLKLLLINMFILDDKIKSDNIKNDIHFFRTMHSIY